jgi:hypothetical protein
MPGRATALFGPAATFLLRVRAARGWRGLAGAAAAPERALAPAASAPSETAAHRPP